MYNPKNLFSSFANRRQKVVKLLREVHAGQVLNQQFPYDKTKSQLMDRSLFFTNLPKQKREKRAKVKVGLIPSGSLVIECKNKNLNHYSGMHYGKFDVIPLASKSWHHRKSKGDYFTILPTKLHPAFVTKEELPDTFEENGVSDKVIEQLSKINVTHPTVIQAKSIQAMLSGRNVFISSECGSGKTIAYLIATIENVLKLKEEVNNGCNSPLAIILLPTKELALQVGELTNSLCIELGINCQTLTGGDIKQLLRNPQTVPIDILICTPLVVKKHLEAKLLSAELCRHVVFDEADTLMEEDFRQQMREFVGASQLNFIGAVDLEVASKKCSQICFVSATAPKDMEFRLREIIKENDFLTVSTSNLHKVISHVPQLFKRVGKMQRPEELLKIVKKTAKERIPTIIFSNKKNTSSWVSHFLTENGIECPKLNQSHESEDRFRNFRNFQLGSTDFISCTDLGSRGLHFERVKRVINFEFPSFIADYIHRCGRVGRLGQGDDCHITNFITTQHDVLILHKIETAVRTNNPLPSVYSDRELKPLSFRGRKGK